MWLLASSCLSVCMELGSHWADFHEIWYFSILRKTVEKFLKFHENLTQELQEDICKFMIIPRWTPLKMRNVSDNRCTENKKNTFFVQSLFSRKSCPLWDNEEKYGTARQARLQYNTAHALCMLDNYGYGDTLRICNTHCFSTATMVTRTRYVYTYCLKARRGLLALDGNVQHTSPIYNAINLMTVTYFDFVDKSMMYS